jgi:hypothetical protein
VTRDKDGGFVVESDKPVPDKAQQKRVAKLVEAAHDEWVEFEGSLRKSLSRAIALGKSIIALKEAVPHGEFEGFFTTKDSQGDLPFTSRWARKLMVMASNEAISNRNHDSDLPSDLNTVHELSLMTAPALESAIAEGKVTPKTTRAEAKRIKQEADGDADEPKERKARPVREAPRKNLEDTLSDCHQAVLEAVTKAWTDYPELRAPIAARLELIAEGLRK